MNIKIKSMSIPLGILLAVSVEAAPLVEFSNGNVADANDVNANFNELATRIQHIDNASQGQTGITEKSIDFASFKHQYSQKTFSVSGRMKAHDTEVWDFLGTGDKLVIKKTQKLSGLVVNTITDTLSQGDGVDTLLIKQEFTITPLTLLNKLPIVSASNNTVSFDPAVILSKPKMITGYSFNSSGKQIATKNVGGVIYSNFTNTGYYIDTRTVLDKESIIAGGTEYTDCAKVETRRTSEIGAVPNFTNISWYCLGEGLVKEIRTTQRVSDQTDRLVPSLYASNIVTYVLLLELTSTVVK